MNTNEKTLNVNTKAILELEMPKSCSECKLHTFQVCQLGLMNKQELYVSGYTKKRHSQCPLQPIVSNEEVDEALSNLELYIESEVECSYQNVLCTNERVSEAVKETQNELLTTIKQALQQPKISEDSKVKPNSCVNVLFNCPKCDESIDNERFNGEPIKYCPNCGQKLKDAINWNTKEYLRKEARIKSLGKGEKI